MMIIARKPRNYIAVFVLEKKKLTRKDKKRRMFKKGT